MGIKRDELTNPNSCLNKADPEEPIFVLRAQDLLAPIVIRLWADLARANKTDEEKVQEAKRLAFSMEQWTNRRYPT